ncbi:MAG: hypothetical protein RR060_03000, partial [Victivallaceae bacterium]
MNNAAVDSFAAPEVNFSGVVRLALTIGDAAGIGPEIALRAAQICQQWKQCRVVLYGSPEVIKAAAEKFTPGFVPEVVAVDNLSLADFAFGRLSARCGQVAYDCVVTAAKDVLAG